MAAGASVAESGEPELAAGTVPYALWAVYSAGVDKVFLAFLLIAGIPDHVAIKRRSRAQETATLARPQHREV